MKTVKEIAEFLKTAHEDIRNYEGCIYTDLDEQLYIVLGNTEEGVLAKLAYNVDDLQCDYNVDWNLPEYVDHDCVLVEFGLDGVEDYEEIAECFLEQFKSVMRHLENGLIVDWRG